jgi:NAD(P)-dependent dehydrogenase (short-subunit alcohol dehydrogenase family)
LTGAAQGIGKATALVLAGYGCDLVIADIQENKLQDTAKEVEKLGRRCLPLKTDVLSTEQIENSVKKAIDEFGHLDILVNAAGIVIASLLVELPEETWDKVMTLNAKSVFICSRAVAKHMIEKNIKGKIVNVASMSTKLGEFGNGVYSCSKAVVGTLTQVFGLELAPYGINVNSICPGPTDTQIMQNVFNERASLFNMTPEEYRQHWITSVPLKRMAKPEEMGELIAFLCSDKSSYMTACNHTIAGGMLII